MKRKAPKLSAARRERLKRQLRANATDKARREHKRGMTILRKALDPKLIDAGRVLLREPIGANNVKPSADKRRPIPPRLLHTFVLNHGYLLRQAKDIARRNAHVSVWERFLKKEAIPYTLQMLAKNGVEYSKASGSDEILAAARLLQASQYVLAPQYPE